MTFRSLYERFIVGKNYCLQNMLDDLRLSGVDVAPETFEEFKFI